MSDYAFQMSSLYLMVHNHRCYKPPLELMSHINFLISGVEINYECHKLKLYYFVAV